MDKIGVWLKDDDNFKRMGDLYEVPRVPVAGEYFTYRDPGRGNNRTARVRAVFIHSTRVGGTPSEDAAEIYVEACDYPFRFEAEAADRVSIPKNWK